MTFAASLVLYLSCARQSNSNKAFTFPSPLFFSSLPFEIVSSIGTRVCNETHARGRHKYEYVCISVLALPLRVSYHGCSVQTGFLPMLTTLTEAAVLIAHARTHSKRGSFDSLLGGKTGAVWREKKLSQLRASLSCSLSLLLSLSHSLSPSLVYHALITAFTPPLSLSPHRAFSGTRANGRV